MQRSQRGRRMTNRPQTLPALAGAGQTPQSSRHELVRVLSKLGLCSRSQAQIWVRDGRVSVDGRIVRDGAMLVVADHVRLAVDGIAVSRVRPVYVMINKPRGLVVSTADERGRDTVYSMLADAGLPWLGAVGRLDKASEGLLLFSNDTVWAAGITNPATHVGKTYHVQIDCVASDALLAALTAGVRAGDDDLTATSARLLRAGEKHSWLEIVLDEGRNRQIRRMLEVQGVHVLRLIRVAIGPLPLGTLGKGEWRHLTAKEVQALSVASETRPRR